MTDSNTKGRSRYLLKYNQQRERPHILSSVSTPFLKFIEKFELDHE